MAGAVAGLSACGATGLAAGSLSASLSDTFAHLYVLQQADQGRPTPPVAALGTSTTCRKGYGSAPQDGAGNDWVCTVTYRGVGLATSVTAGYDVDLRTDGCYSAEADGPASVNTPLGEQEVGEASRTITGLGSKQIVNPLWRIESCFDTA